MYEIPHDYNMTWKEILPVGDKSSHETTRSKVFIAILLIQSFTLVLGFYLNFGNTSADYLQRKVFQLIKK